MNGKAKCAVLKEIRRRIAKENGIPYETEECAHTGECLGTCPRCESEVRYLERQLARRERLGNRIAVAALCAGMALSAAACAPADGGRGELGGATQLVAAQPTAEPEPLDIEGEVAYWDEDDIAGGLEYRGPEEEPVETWDLTGDVAWTEPAGHE